MSVATPLPPRRQQVSANGKLHCSFRPRLLARTRQISERRFIYDARGSSSPFSDSQYFENMKKIKLVPGRGLEFARFNS
jgi:hypothetical protein